MEFAIGWFILLAVGFFFLIVRPQRRQIAAHRALLASLGVGDDVITAGGVYGTIRALRDDVIELEIADGVVIRLARAAIARPAGPPDQLVDGAEGADGEAV
jgi:preprotein translocase subunit YajC